MRGSSRLVDLEPAELPGAVSRIKLGCHGNGADTGRLHALVTSLLGELAVNFVFLTIARFSCLGFVLVAAKSVAG